MTDSSGPPRPAFRVDASLGGKVVVGWVSAAPVAVGPAAEPLEREMGALEAEMRERFAGRTPSQVEELAAARTLYRAFGIDPTKTRPSSEALLRRVLRDKPLPRIFNAVDVCNLLAVRFLLPLGLYDAGRIRGEVLLRAGEEGESYAGIRKDEVHLSGRPVLVDGEGPFGNPTSDSLRTCVEPSTASLWMVIFAPGGTAAATMERHVEVAGAAMAAHLAPAGSAVATCGEVVA